MAEVTGQRRGSVAVISLEPWDRVWRRNQHLVAELVGQRLVGLVRFISPPVKLRHVPRARPLPGVEVRTPHLLVPRRRGGDAVVAAEVSLVTRTCDVLWVNDARLGVHVLRRGQPVVYDVTDDWRTSEMSDADRTALVAAEDLLAVRATTVVCSQVLADRWADRYRVEPVVIQNGVALAAHALASGRPLPGPGPHIVYVGSLHRERLDLALLLALAAEPTVGQVDLVGPDSLDDASKRALAASGKIVLHGPVSHEDVPSIMAGADVLICPHLVDFFTMSLDAIKSFEYLATRRPVVATPTSGFQLLRGVPGLHVVESRSFVQAVVSALTAPEAQWAGRADLAGWDARARQFASALEGVVGRG